MTILCRSDDIGENEAKGFDVGEHAVIAVRRDGLLHVYMNWCPHLGIQLNFDPDEFFDLDRYYLQCANHGAIFEVENGLCVRGPCKGMSLRKIGFEEKDGEVRIIDIPERSR